MQKVTKLLFFTRLRIQSSLLSWQDDNILTILEIAIQEPYPFYITPLHYMYPDDSYQNSHLSK